MAGLPVNSSGANQIYVRPASGHDGQWVVSTQPVSMPIWSRNGQDLFYLTADNQVMAAHYTANGTPSWRTDRVCGWRKPWETVMDITADGKRLVTRVPDRPAAAPVEHELVFLQNFFDELRRRVPVGR
jgi:hypothetical protein